MAQPMIILDETRQAMLTLDHPASVKLALAVRLFTQMVDRNPGRFNVTPGQRDQLEDLRFFLTEAVAAPIAGQTRPNPDTNPDTGRDLPDHSADEPLTQTEAARRAGRSARTIRRWIDSGDLPAVQTGGVRRVSQRDLDAYLAATDPAVNDRTGKKPR